MPNPDGQLTFAEAVSRTNGRGVRELFGPPTPEQTRELVKQFKKGLRGVKLPEDNPPVVVSRVPPKDGSAPPPPKRARKI